MPRVPVDTPQFSMNVPGANAPYSREFGKIGNSLAGMGSEVEDSGLNLLQKVKQAEAVNASSNAYYQTQLDSEQQMQQLKLRSPDGYVRADKNDRLPITDPNSTVLRNADNTPKTILDAFHDWANDRYQSDQQAMPTMAASEMYKVKALPYMSTQIGLLNTERQQMLVRSFDQDQTNAIMQKGDQLVSNPNTTNFYSHAADIQDQNNKNIGVMGNVTDMQERTVKAQKSLSRDLLQGAYTQVLSQKKLGDEDRTIAINNWRAVLAGTDADSIRRKQAGLPILANMMDPMQKAIEEEKLIKLLPGAKIADLSDYHRNVQESVNALSNGNSDPEATQEILSQTFRLARSGDLTPIEAAQNIGTLMGNAAIADHLSDPAYRIMTLDQKRALGEKVAQNVLSTAQTLAKTNGVTYATNVGAIAANSVRSVVQQNIQRDEEAKQKDFAGFYQSLPMGKKMSLLDYDHPTSLGVSSSRATLQQGIGAQASAFKASTYNNSAWWRPISQSEAGRMASFLTDPENREGDVVHRNLGHAGQAGFVDPDHGLQYRQRTRRRKARRDRVVGIHPHAVDVEGDIGEVRCVDPVVVPGARRHSHSAGE